MNLSQLKDREILLQLKILVQNERELLTSILHHLREVERRRLFSDLKYSSLFEYAMKELKYSEAQAVRRIGAMRLLKELPQVEEKIQDGSLNLSNLCQAQTYFRNSDKKSKAEKSPLLSAEKKIEVLELLENKSTREGERFLLSLQPEGFLPPEKERVLTPTHSEIRFTMDEELKKNLEQVRSLLGLKGLGMSFAELANEMALMCVQLLKQKTFGKKRVQQTSIVNTEKSSENSEWAQNAPSAPKVAMKPKTISKALKFRVWQRDKGKCTQCSGTRNLNYDHIQPKALGGENSFENLRLLCFHCNQRRATKTFGNVSRPNTV